MKIEADFTITIKLFDVFMSNDSSDEEIKEMVTQEGEKRLRYYLSGYLLDPEKKIINKEVSIKMKNN